MRTDNVSYNVYMEKNNLKGLDFIIEKVSSKANKAIDDAINKAEQKYWKSDPNNKDYYISLQDGVVPSDYEIEEELPGQSFDDLIDDVAKKILKRHKKEFLILLNEEDNLTIEESENLYKELVNTGSFYDKLFELHKKKVISREDTYLLQDKLRWYP